jgi:hypothetical protein
MCDALFEMIEIMLVSCFTARRPSASHIQSIHELCSLKNAELYQNTIKDCFVEGMPITGIAFRTMKFQLRMTYDLVKQSFKAGIARPGHESNNLHKIHTPSS